MNHLMGPVTTVWISGYLWLLVFDPCCADQKNPLRYLQDSPLVVLTTHQTVFVFLLLGLYPWIWTCFTMMAKSSTTVFPILPQEWSEHEKYQRNGSIMMVMWVLHIAHNSVAQLLDFLGISDKPILWLYDQQMFTPALVIGKACLTLQQEQETSNIK